MIKGYEQLYRIDFEKTFALITKFITLHILFMLATQFDQEIEQINVVTTFFNSELYKEVYIEQPEGFIKLSMSRRILYYQLRKCLYRFKQALYKWYIDIDNYFVNSLSLTYFSEDSNLYINILANIILLFYVNDILLFFPNKKAINLLKSKLIVK